MAFNGGELTELETYPIDNDPDFSRTFVGRLRGESIEGKLVKRAEAFKGECGRNALITKHGDADLHQWVVLYDSPAGSVRIV